MIANGLAHFGIAPTESILSYRTLPSPVPLVALATLLQKDLNFFFILINLILLKSELFLSIITIKYQ